MAYATFERSRLATVFGGSGFVGRHIVRALARRGWRVRIAVRRPDLAAFLQTLGMVGQIHAGAGESSAFRLRSRLRSKAPRWSSTRRACGPRAVRRPIRPCMSTERRRSLAPRLRPVLKPTRIFPASGPTRPPPRPISRARASARAPRCKSSRTRSILRPSVVFGPEDDFFNRFGALARFFPVIPLFGGGKTRLQPVYAGDVARAVAAALASEVRPGVVYELGGPLVMTLREAAELVLRTSIAADCWSDCLSAFRAARLDDLVRRQGDARPLSQAPDNELAIRLTCSPGTMWCRTRPRPKSAFSRAFGIAPQAPDAIIPRLSCAVSQDGPV